MIRRKENLSGEDNDTRQLIGFCQYLKVNYKITYIAQKTDKIPYLWHYLLSVVVIDLSLSLDKKSILKSQSIFILLAFVQHTIKKLSVRSYRFKLT